MVADRGPAWPAESDGDMAEQVRECEVVVVGAGYSGLAAARHLARSGVDVLVLDARHRVGGRSFTDVTAAGFTIDRGGQWIGPTQDHLAALATELGIATVPTYTTGEGVELRDGGRDTYVGLIPTSDPHGAADGIAAMLDLDLAAFDVPVDAPWDAPDAAGLDAQTLATWFDAHLSSASARAILEVAVKAVFGTGSGELSLLFALFYLHAGGGLTNLARSTGGAQERRFAGGSQQLAEGMADELGARVLLGAPVETVAYAPDEVVVGGRLVAPGNDPADPSAEHRPLGVRARRADLRHATRAQRAPLLPAWAARTQGAAVPAHAHGSRHQDPRDVRPPFWRDDGLNGQIVAPGSALGATFDNSPEDAHHGEIVGFIAGDDCRRLEVAGPDVRREVVLADLERAFGPRARTPIEVVEQHWPAEPFTRGGPVAISSPGACYRARPGAARARGAVALGGDRDGDAVVRLPRRRALRRAAGGRRGAGCAEGRARWPRLRSCSRPSPSGAPAATGTHA